MNLKQLLEALEQKRAALKVILEKGDSATLEDADQADTLKTEMLDLKSKVERLNTLEESRKASEEINTFLNARPSNGGEFKHSHAETNAATYAGSTIKKFAVPASSKRVQVKSFTNDPQGGMTAHEKAYGFGKFLLATIGNNADAKKWCAEHGIEIKAQTESNNSAGGFLVPPEFDNDIIDLREAFGVIRANARITTMTSDTKTIKRRKGGVTAYFVGENGTITDSQKTWDNVNLTAKKIAALVLYSSELNEDAIIEMADDLAEEIAYAFANKEDDCAFNGDGTSTYGDITGLINKMLNLSGTKANIAGLVQGTGSGFTGLVLGDFTKMVGRLPQYADAKNRRKGPGAPNAPSTDVKWYMHRSFYYGTALTLALASGGVTEKEVIEMYTGAATPMFLGYPVEFAQVLAQNSASNIVPCLFGNIKLAGRFGNRRQTTIAMSTDRYFENDEMAIKGTERFAFTVHDVGNANATASLRVPGPVIELFTG